MQSTWYLLTAIPRRGIFRPMNQLHPQPDERPTIISLRSTAEDNLRFIRSAMERSTSFTGVSGRGYLLAGISAVVASALAATRQSPEGWLFVWMIELVVGGTVAFGLTVRKSRQQGAALWSGSGRKLLIAFVPTMLAGGLLTVGFAIHGLVNWLPGVWMTLYGAAVMTAGARSVRAIPVMSASFLGLGALTRLLPATGNVILALGFGGLHMAFGIYIWRHHGG